MAKKYTVFKAHEFDRYKTRGGIYLPPFPQEVEDGIVIRRQDIFAAPGLTAYADSIRTTLNVIQENTQGTPDILCLVDRLQDLADYFHEEAKKAWTTPYRKIPD